MHGIVAIGNCTAAFLKETLQETTEELIYLAELHHLLALPSTCSFYQGLNTVLVVEVSCYISDVTLPSTSPETASMSNPYFTRSCMQDT